MTTLTETHIAADLETKGGRIALWAARIVAALIMGQTLAFKFSGAPEPIEIFTTLGVEPFGRYATAILELAAVVLLLAPLGARALALGGALTVGLMAGAVGSHLTLLGIEVAGDGGALFGMALVTLFAGAFVTWKRRGDLPLLGR